MENIQDLLSEVSSFSHLSDKQIIYGDSRKKDYLLYDDVKKY